MFPGMDKRAVDAAMRKMGVTQQSIPAEEVVIKIRGNTEIVIKEPQVTRVTMMGQESFQIAGEYVERPRVSAMPQLTFNEEDVKTVATQAGVPETEAKVALAKVNGDLAAAIMLLEEKKK